MRKLKRLLFAGFFTSCIEARATNELNGVPFFWTFTGNSPKYHDAAFKAQEVFLLETGVTPFYNQVATKATQNANSATVAFINDQTPFSAIGVYSFIAAAYEIGVKKQVSASFANPIWRNIHNTISISENSANLGVSFKF